MIVLHIGNLGSGKTACVVRQMAMDKSPTVYLSNIHAKLKNCIPLTGDMIVKKEVAKVKKTGEEQYKFSFNEQFWRDFSQEHKRASVVIDEAHILMNPRKSMHKASIIVQDFVSLLRRFVGQDSAGAGQLILLTQLPRRVDVIVRELATTVVYHRCWFRKKCNKCGRSWREHSDFPQPITLCPACGSWDLKKYSFLMELWYFRNMDTFLAWRDYREPRLAFRHKVIRDIEQYFNLYSTFQWENMFSDMYK